MSPYLSGWTHLDTEMSHAMRSEAMMGRCLLVDLAPWRQCDHCQWLNAQPLINSSSSSSDSGGGGGGSRPTRLPMTLTSI